MAIVDTEVPSLVKEMLVDVAMGVRDFAIVVSITGGYILLCTGIFKACEYLGFRPEFKV